MALTTINVNKQFPVGSIIQTVSSTKLDAYSNNATSLTDITGTDQDGNGPIWCAKITPSSASNKILVLAHISFNATDSGAGLVLFRGTSQIYKGAAVGSRNSFSVTGLYGNAVANTATNNTYSGGISHMSYLDDGDSGNGDSGGNDQSEIMMVVEADMSLARGRNKSVETRHAQHTHRTGSV